MTKHLLISVIVLFSSQPCFASITAGVPSPSVKANAQDITYRLGYSSNTSANVSLNNHWLHYQKSIANDSSIRFIADLQGQRGDSPTLTGARVQYLWVTSPQKTAFRFEFRVRKSNAPEQFTLAWSKQYSISPSVNLVTVLLGALQVGQNAKSSVQIGARSALNYKTNDTTMWALETYSNLGRFNNLLDFGDQTHYVGVRHAKTWGNIKANVGYLRGLNSSGTKHNFRVWLTYQL